MKKILALLSISILITVKGYSQQRDTTRHKESDKHRMMRFIGQRLNVDSVKAKQVEVIQSNYKAGVARLMATGSLTEQQKRQGMDSLVKQKNTSLSLILTPEQQAKIIPSTEWRKDKQTEKKQH